jgi:hypothetical protein
MVIKRKFEDLILFMEDPYKAEKLISKKTKFDIYGKFNNKVTNIKIGSNQIICQYNVDGRYEYKLLFNRTGDGCIDFSIRTSGAIYLIIAGVFLGVKLFQYFGTIGIGISLVLVALIALITKLYLQQSIWTRINERWNEVAKI